MRLLLFLLVTCSIHASCSKETSVENPCKSLIGVNTIYTQDWVPVSRDTVVMNGKLCGSELQQSRAINQEGYADTVQLGNQWQVLSLHYVNPR